MQIRKATLEDIDTLVRLRLDFLEEDEGLTPAQSETIERQMRGYLGAHMGDGAFIAALAEEDGHAVSTACVIIAERPANPHFLNGRVGTLLNVFTYPPYRRQGIATRIISLLMEEAAKLGVSSIELLATEAGRPVYEKLGFHPVLTAMRISL